jgi:hypothetical protein
MDSKEVPAAAPQLEPGDALFGGQEITDFVNELWGTDYEVQTIYGWINRGLLPAGKFGARVVGSRRAIRERAAQAAGLTK